MIAQQTLHIPTQSANATDEWYMAWGLPGVWRILKILFAPATAVAIDGTDNLTVNVTVNDGAGGSDSSSVGTFNTNTGGTALVLKTTIDVTLTNLDSELRAGRQLKFAKTLAASGKILDGTFTVVCQKMN